MADKFKKAESLFSTTLSASISTGTGETITLASVSGLPTDTEITITVDRVDANGNATPAKLERITGTLSGSNLTSYTRGTDGTTEQSHSSGAVIEYIWNSHDWNDLVDGILVGHNQDGTHDPAIIYDTNKNEEIKFTTTASAVNEVTVTNAATGNAPELSATGGDTNIDLKLKGKGTGHAQAYDNESASYFDLVPNSSLSRQAIINGNFDVWQRGTSFSHTSDAYTADRWITAFTGPETTARSTDVPDINSLYSLKITATMAASDAARISYKMEGSSSGRFSGKTITLSFWLKIDDTTNLETATGNGTYLDILYPSALDTFTTTETAIGLQTIAIPTANTWTKYSYALTLPSVSPATSYSIANGLQISIRFRKNATVETLTKNIYLAQVQLCAGEVALPFQPKSFEEELRACQRYYYRNTASDTYSIFCMGQAYSATEFDGVVFLPVTMRSLPTFSYGGTLRLDNATATGLSISTLELNSIGDSFNTPTLSVVVASGLVAGNASKLRASNDATAYIAFSAEL